MSSETWKIIQEHKRKQETLREKLQKRRKERQGEIISPTTTDSINTVDQSGNGQPAEALIKTADTTVEEKLKKLINECTLMLPMKSEDVRDKLKEVCSKEHPVSLEDVEFMLMKLATTNIITVQTLSEEKRKAMKCASTVEIISLQNDKTLTQETKPEKNDTESNKEVENKKLSSNKNDKQLGKRGSGDRRRDSSRTKSSKSEKSSSDDIEELLNAKSAKEQDTTRVNDEIQELLSTASTKEISLSEKFRSMGGSQVREFCPHATREECLKHKKSYSACQKLHFRKILKAHTDESLGDCSFLNTCFHMDTCKYVHYEIDYRGTDLDPRKSRRGVKKETQKSVLPKFNSDEDYISRKMLPPQWISCDIRYLDVSVLGKFSVIMADPPWDIHMELPYGTMQDDEMRALRIQDLSDDGLMFLWVTGRAMELGRELFDIWGYKRCDELIWVKTNQLQRLIRTGRTGHWINHGKEHCLVGIKGNPQGINRGLDCDVLVAEVRDTSHKPDEIYGLIERLSPGTRKLELFGRVHNLQPNWVTLGNQLDGVHLAEYEVIAKFKKKYPDGKVTKPNEPGVPPY
uniref:mRNA m(6)A methyltransferase n=1 Tax=Ciona savignyi TaxID=51511 RepID=H2Y8F1_CIOSA